MTTKISSKYQVVIPKAVREQAKFREGQRLHVYSMGDSVVLSPQPRSYTQKMLGLGEQLWQGIDPLEYIRSERANWDQKHGH